MKKFLSFFIAFAMFGLVANSQNYVVDETNDTIDITTTWSYDTVFVDTSLTILDNIILTIDPGTVIMFNGFHKFNVEGTLLSEGTETDTIKYTVSDTTGYFDFSHIGWDGIEFDNELGNMDDNDTSYFSYCGFYYGYNKDYDWYEGTGGAVKLRFNAYAEFSNCEFAYNTTIRAGGAIGIVYDAIAVIDSCSFYYNNAVYNDDGDLTSGGAIAIGCQDDDTFFDQTIISNCYFYRNSAFHDQTSDDARYGGGAVKISGYSDALVKNCIFEENFSTTQGGAMIISGYAQPYIVNNLFKNNSAQHNGGAVALKYYAGGYHINNTVVGNSSANDGGAYSIGCDNDSCFFVNNIIVANSDFENDYDQFYIASEDSDMKFYNNNIQGGFDYSSTIQFDNIDVLPLFLDFGNDDYRLACNSPCKDIAKDTLNYFPDFDLAGMPRFADAGYDLGAFEIQSAVPVDLGDDVSVCEGNTAILDAGADYNSYLWSTTDDTQTIEVSDADTYSVTVTNEYLCEATDEIALTVNPLPVVDLGDDVSICEGNTTILDPGAGYESYLWSTTDETQTIEVSVSDTYSVVVTNEYLCEATDEIVLTVNPLPVVDLGEDQTINNTQSIDLDAGEFEGYLWSTDETSQTITVDGAVLGVGVFDYSVTVTDVNTCEGVGEIQITVEDAVGINKLNIQETAVYPNPNNGIFNVETIGNVQIVDITGRVIKNISVNGIATIDISSYPNGIYILKVSNTEETKEYKVFVN